MDENGEKNGFDPSVGKDTQFNPENQPSPEAKKKGWERRRMAQEMMNLYDKYMHMNYKEFLAIKSDVKENPQNYTTMEVDMFRYAKSPKFIIDRIDRHISKAPQDIDVTSGGEKIEGVVVRFVKGKNGTENTDNSGNGSNSPSGEDNRGGEEV